MARKDDLVREEVEALWAEVFGEPPTIHCEPGLLAEVLIRSLSSPPPYGDPPFQRDREPLPPHRPRGVTNLRLGPN